MKLTNKLSLKKKILAKTQRQERRDAKGKGTFNHESHEKHEKNNFILIHKPPAWECSNNPNPVYVILHSMHDGLTL